MTFVSWLIIYHMMYIMLYARKLKCVAFHCTVNISFDVLDSFLLWVDKISYFIVTLSRLLGYNLQYYNLQEFLGYNINQISELCARAN